VTARYVAEADTGSLRHKRFVHGISAQSTALAVKGDDVFVVNRLSGTVGKYDAHSR